MEGWAAAAAGLDPGAGTPLGRVAAAARRLQARPPGEAAGGGDDALGALGRAFAGLDGAARRRGLLAARAAWPLAPAAARTRFLAAVAAARPAAEAAALALCADLHPAAAAFRPGPCPAAAFRSMASAPGARALATGTAIAGGPAPRREGRPRLVGGEGERKRKRRSEEVEAVGEGEGQGEGGAAGEAPNPAAARRQRLARVRAATEAFDLAAVAEDVRALAGEGRADGGDLGRAVGLAGLGEDQLARLLDSTPDGAADLARFVLEHGAGPRLAALAAPLSNALLESLLRFGVRFPRETARGAMRPLLAGGLNASQAPVVRRLAADCFPAAVREEALQAAADTPEWSPVLVGVLQDLVSLVARGSPSAATVAKLVAGLQRALRSGENAQSLPHVKLLVHVVARLKGHLRPHRQELETAVVGTRTMLTKAAIAKVKAL